MSVGITAYTDGLLIAVSVLWCSESSKNFIMKLKISVAKRLKLYDLIVEENI